MGFIHGNNRVNSLTTAAGLCAALWLSPALAGDDLQSLADVQATAETWVVSQLQQDHDYTDLQVNATPLDNRLRLHACDRPLEAFGTVGNVRSGRMTVGIRCGSPQPWTLYVPVQVHASVAVLALTSSLAKGAVLGKQDVVLVNRNVLELPQNYLNDPAQAVNMALSRAVQADTLLTQPMLQEPLVVNKGQAVTIVAEGSSYAVKMLGTALQNGAAGQRIGVRNTTSGRTVEAVIVDAATVKVGL